MRIPSLFCSDPLNNTEINTDKAEINLFIYIYIYLISMIYFTVLCIVRFHNVIYEYCLNKYHDFL